MTALHSHGFVAQWRKMLVELYGYDQRDGVILVPGITGQRTAVHVPLLSYSELNLSEAQALRGRLADQGAYQVRVLDGSVETFQPNETVTMRLNLASGSEDEVFNGIIPSKCRNHIRKSEKSGIRIRVGVQDDLVDDFYRVWGTTMHRFGTPVFSRRLFSALPKHVDTQYLVGYLDGKPVSGVCLVLDEKVAWVPWAGSLMEYRNVSPNHILYWHAIRMSLDAGRPVFDFGRSGYQAPTFVFKEEWGAEPVRVLTLSSNESDVYSKYTLASSIWKRLPRALVDVVGPRLCRYLPDL
ncbi:MAG: GNAT family N-acetyltransferase [Hydrogenophaga sp.]|nr:GNAT family N-acetyltransferase [Hydrogenophaga sp.]